MKKTRIYVIGIFIFVLDCFVAFNYLYRQQRTLGNTYRDFLGFTVEFTLSFCVWQLPQRKNAKGKLIVLRSFSSFLIWSSIYCVSCPCLVICLIFIECILLICQFMAVYGNRSLTAIKWMPDWKKMSFIMFRVVFFIHYIQSCYKLTDRKCFRIHEVITWHLLSLRYLGFCQWWNNIGTKRSPSLFADRK